MNPALLLGVFAAITFVVLTQGRVGADAGEKRVEAWASGAGLRLQAVEHTTAREGGPWGRYGRGTQFYRVTVVDASGATRVGSVRVQSNWTFASGKLDVHWQQP